MQAPKHATLLQTKDKLDDSIDLKLEPYPTVSNVQIVAHNKTNATAGHNNKTSNLTSLGVESEPTIDTNFTLPNKTVNTTNSKEQEVVVPYSVGEYMNLHHKKINESHSNMTEALFRGKGLEKHLERKSSSKDFIRSKPLYWTIAGCTFLGLAILILKICCCEGWCEDPDDIKSGYRMSMDGFTRDAEAVSLYEGGMFKNSE